MADETPFTLLESQQEGPPTPPADPDCPDGNWDPEPWTPDTKGGSQGEDEEEIEKASVCVSVCALLAAVPALIGSWCWPILMGAMFAVAANNVPGKLVEFFHGVQVAIMATLMTNIVQFGWWSTKKRRNKPGATHMGTFWSVYVLMVSTVLVMVQPTCMLVIGSFKLHNFFFDGDSNTNALVPNTVLGWMIQIFCTYLGFILMFVGVFGATKLHLKLRNKWRRLRHAAS